MPAIFSEFILRAVEHLYVFGYWAAFLAAFFETIIGFGFLIPGSTIILLLGAASARGVLDFGDLFLFAVVGAIIGDNVNYYLGKKFGAKWAKQELWLFNSKHLKKAKLFFDTYGAKSIFLGRFIPGLKETIPFFAGYVDMRRVTFFVWNILGAIGWGFEWILAGYIFAQSLGLASLWLTRTGLFFAAVLFVFLVFYILKWLIIKKGKSFFVILKSLLASIVKAIAENKEFSQFINRHARFFSFIKKRVDYKKFSGLTLSLLLLAFLYVLILLGGVIEDVIKLDTITVADTHIANLLAVFRNTELSKIFLWLTMFGKAEIVFVFFVSISAILWLRRQRRYILPFFIAIAGSGAFTYLGKIIFHRPRPEFAYYTEHGFSFPSGHATMAMAFYGFLSYLLIKNLKSWKAKVNSFFFGVIIILLIGFSRLYLGVHYLSDVWGGYLVGALWLVISISFSEWISSLINQSGEKEPSHKKFIFPVLIVLGSIVFYVGLSLHYMPKATADKNVLERQTIEDVNEIFSREQLKFTETVTAQKQEPLDFIILADTDKKLINAFARAGWVLADKPGLFSLAKIAKAALLKEPYANAPMTPSFWNSQVNDFGFEKATAANNVRQRHHARFWKTNYVTPDNKNIYVGTASLDIGIKWGVTHKISPDIDTEREYLLNDIKAGNNTISIKEEQFSHPALGENFSGDPFFTDGKLYLIKL